MEHRRTTRKLRFGRLAVGGNARVVIQSMTNTPTRDPVATLSQVRRLAAVGCGLVRVAVTNERDADSLAKITTRSPIPLVADIQFSHRAALAAIRAGAHGSGLNPGNFSPDYLREICAAAKKKRIPIRIGVNSGSLPRGAYRSDPAANMAAAAARFVRLLESFSFTDIEVSLKSSDVRETLQANRAFASGRSGRYPLHLGLTEAGPELPGSIKTAVALGGLLLDGLGSSLRISLSSPPENEVRVARVLLRACGLYERGIDIVSCPTCGRTVLPVEAVASELAAATRDIDCPRLTVAVMGCAVNGPGEAREADLGVAGEGKRLVFFSRGRPMGTLPRTRILPFLMKEINKRIKKGARK